jgi:transposase
MRPPLSSVERERIYQGRLSGRTLAELATELQCSVMCVRKWARRLRDEGALGLRARRRGRPVQGLLSSFDTEVRQQVLNLKRQHRGWGADRVRVALQTAARLGGRRVPHRSQLAVFFKVHCPECVSQPQPREVKPPPAHATAAHEVWKLDAQEGIRLQDQTIATICNIRDPFAAAMIASCAFAVQTPKRWRKLTWQEYQQVVRAAAALWGTLPDALQTDNELGLAGTANDPFPGRLTLWLAGLGIEHRLSRPGRPTDNAQVERNHRTLDGWALDAEGLADLNHLQQALDRERQVYNEHFPCRASDCQRRPPLVAHPELRLPRHAYALEHEGALFDLTRMDRYLASFTFLRQVSAVGRVSLGRQMYSVGRQWAGRKLSVRFDADSRDWVFFEQGAPDELLERVRRPSKRLTAADLIGPLAQPVEPGPAAPP